MITELIENIENINDEIFELLEYEVSIYEKKIKGQKLSNKEKFFDLYVVKPSTIFMILLRKEK